MINLLEKENEILSELKDFQRATVERCFELFKSGQKRILVADEVGLGKTLVAKGVIARLARHHKEDLNDNLFKVVYICSNQTIARQNIEKLYDGATVDGVSEARLTMQHLRIFEQEHDKEILDRYIQLIPLTPATSFNITSTCGSVEERALMFALLKRLDCFIAVLPYFETMMQDAASYSWGAWCRDYYEKRVFDCNTKTKNYISKMTSRLNKKLKKELIDKTIEHCIKIKDSGNRFVSGANNIIYELRQIFAEISIHYLKPDLVIMDEFQRFRELINAAEDTETGKLSSRFLKTGKVNTLLLSATPYKLYQTLDEMSESGADEHFSEFLEVMSFLFGEEERESNFNEVWRNFSVSLRETSNETSAVIEVKKTAEDAMYQVVCRTERMLVDNDYAILDDSGAKTSLDITTEDILSFVEAEKLTYELEQKVGIPVDYVKSSPYLLSFMENYQLKRDIKKYFRQNPEEISKAKKRRLWVDKSTIQNFKELSPNNARLKKLQDIAFDKKAEHLLWIPPSMPYYELGGVFKNNPNYSKILVFSAWDMVPRMIATTISFEAERLTVGKIYHGEVDNNKKDYFAKSRFPFRLLRYNQIGAQPLFTLIYPSVTLSKLYNPSAEMGKGINEIRKQISQNITLLLEDIRCYVDENARKNADTRWYYLAPVLFDLREEETLKYFEQSKSEDKMQREKFEELLHFFQNTDTLKLGSMPKDLVEVLTNMTIASPAVCAMRLFNDSVLASDFAKEIMNIFNTPEAISSIELLYGKTGDDAYYKNVLKYSVDGNLQAVLDEYVHMLNEKVVDRRAQKMIDAIKINTASYPVDTYQSFKSEIEGRKEQKLSMRSHFAVGFYNSGSDRKNSQRKDSLRTAFNSPFRPFVLATTSIGQEGLDFHFYCRKIMHWNLPSNPIDLEQREGRINRYKCLAIRQNISKLHGNIDFKEDIWNEMFEAAIKIKDEKDSDLVPYWCLPDDCKIKIERIVPMYPLSKDGAAYERLIKILSLYRLTLGQARQEELLEYLFYNVDDFKELEKLFINLSPYFRKMDEARLLDI